MVIGKTMRGTTYFASVLFNSAIYKYAKKRGLWYYRLLLSQQFSDVINDVYEMNRLEKKLNPDPFSSIQKKVFSVDEQGNIYDDKTGEVFGNTKEHINNKFDMDNEEEYFADDIAESKANDAEMQEEEVVKPKRGRPRKS